LTWFGNPSVGLDMELHNAGVDVYFRLVIEALSVGVHINHLSLDGVTCEMPCDGSRFSKAIDTARFPVVPNRTGYWNCRPETAIPG
jgi:hypothetical protein